MKRMFADAAAHYQKAWQVSDDPRVLALLGHTYAVSGNREEALKVLTQLQEISKSRYVSTYSFAALYAGLREKDQAFKWLEKSYQDRSFGDIGYIKVDPLLDNLRSDPRFTELVRRMGLQP
jgi:tetratricopeptide (TPR) repeat protein